MNRILASIFLSLCLVCTSSLGQSTACTTGDNAEYTKKIKEYTTEPFFITELVDHLPYNSCVPSPDVLLHHIVGAPEMLMELAYRLAVEETPFIQKIRKDSIVMITPLVETDGHDRMVDVYMQHKKHPNDPQYPLVWWGHYVAHDNNRDNLGLSLALSRNMLKTFLEWHPTVMHDLHESVPYLYIMTGTGPYNALLDPIAISEWQQMAYHEIQEMTKRGVVGVWTHGFYDGWAPNYLLSIANSHNAIGRFYETFGNGGADTRVRTLRPRTPAASGYRPNPPL